MKTVRSSTNHNSTIIPLLNGTKSPKVSLENAHLRSSLFLCSFLILLGTCAHAQGPISGFPTPRGEVAVALGYSFERYDTYLQENGREEARDIETLSYNLFIEAGLSENTALVATLPWMQVNNGEGSLQDGSLWIKYMNADKRLKKGHSRFFTAVGLSFPVGGYSPDGIAAIGQRGGVFQGRLAYQYQHDSGFFLHGQTGIDFQFSPEARSSWPLLLRTGYGNKYFYVEGWIEFVTALESGSGVQAAAGATGSSWQRLGATFYVPVRPWIGAQIGGAWITGGEFIGRSNRLNTGLVFKL
jgi:hypothetical protein